MNKLVLNYTPNDSSNSIADGLVGTWAETLLNDMHHSYGETLIRNCANESQVLVVRVLVKKGLLESKHITLQYEGEELSLDVNGRLDNWPDGFCDVQEKLLFELF